MVTTLGMSLDHHTATCQYIALNNTVSSLHITPYYLWIHAVCLGTFALQLIVSSFLLIYRNTELLILVLVVVSLAPCS